MKKIYILAIAAFAFTLNMNAQFADDFEGYDEGTITDQADNFYNWSGDGGGAESGTVTSEQASNGTKSMYVSTGNDFIFDFVPFDACSVVTVPLSAPPPSPLQL